MKKQIEVKQKKEVYYCDICGKQLSKHRKCEICGRDVCQECSIFFDWDILKPDAFEGDYPSVMCVECWDKGKKYRDKILELREECEKKEEELISEWKNNINNPV